MVVGERDELVRVAENLIENAIKYGAQPEPRPRRTVEIAVARKRQGRRRSSCATTAAASRRSTCRA